MKKGVKTGLLSLLLCGVLLAAYQGTRGGGDVSQAAVTPVESALYSASDLDAAADTVLRYFQEEFEGCSLRELHYIGDGAAEQFAEWAEQYGVEEAVVLLSSFDVDASGGDGSLNPHETYKDWQWVLGRSAGGAWEHLTHGYG